MTFVQLQMSYSRYLLQVGQTHNRPFFCLGPTVTTRQPLDFRAVCLMLVLCLTWSMQQIGLRATASDFSPVLQIGLRSGVSAILVAVYMRVRGLPMRGVAGAFWPGAMSGFLFGFEYLLVGEALRLTSAAHVAVFLYTAPIFAALGLHWKLPSERLAGLQWAGIVLAFFGIVASFALRLAPANANWGQLLLGDALALLGGMAWGATTVVIRSTRLGEMPPGLTLFYQLVGAFVLLVPSAFWMGQLQIRVTPLVIANFAFQAVLVSFVSFLVWFWLLRHYLASRLGVFAFMTPLFGVVLGAWLLKEPIEPAFVVGAVLVLLGVVLVSAHGGIAQALGRWRRDPQQKQAKTSI